MFFNISALKMCIRDRHGTRINLFLKENTDDENYDQYLDEYEIQRLVKKYSDYVHYPIEMDIDVYKRQHIRSLMMEGFFVIKIS